LWVWTVSDAQMRLRDRQSSNLHLYIHQPLGVVMHIHHWAWLICYFSKNGNKNILYNEIKHLNRKLTILLAWCIVMFFICLYCYTLFIYFCICAVTAHASLTGTQHFMTFDKKFFEFAGECSYLLARDFIDKSFAVIVNYDKVT